MSVLLRRPSDGSQITVEDDQADYLINAGWTRVYDAYVGGVFSSGHILQTPDIAQLRLTGDLDVRAKIQPADWTPSVIQVITSKTSTGSNRGWFFRLETNGTLRFEGSQDGTTPVGVSSSTPVPFADGNDGWVRVTFTAATSKVDFYTSTDGVTWTPLGTQQTLTGITALFPSTQPAEIGIRAAGTEGFSGRVYYVEWRNGINGAPVLVVDLDSAIGSTMHLDPSGGTFIDALGLVWTRFGTNVKIVGLPNQIAGVREQVGYLPAVGHYTPGAARALIHRLRSGVENAGALILGDGTGLDNNEWFIRTFDWLASKFPKYTLTNVGWSDAGQCWDPAALGGQWQRQVGSLGDAYLTGFAGGNNLQCAGAPAYTGSFAVKAKVRATDWTPATPMVITSKTGNAGNRGWYLYLTSAGALALSLSTDGTAQFFPTSTASVPFADNTDGWVKAELAASSGNIEFFTSTDGVNWTKLGNTVNAGASGVFFSSTANGEIGSRNAGTEPWLGRIYYVEWRSGANPTYPNIGLAVDFDVFFGSSLHITASGGASLDVLGKQWDRTGGAIKLGGSPGLVLFNGSFPGATSAYYTDGPRWNTMKTIKTPDLAFLNIGHSETNPGSSFKGPYLQIGDACVTQWPDVGVVVAAQSLQTSPRTANQIALHTTRQQVAVSLANRRRWGLIDSSFALTADPRGLLALVQASDGMNPTSDGRDLMTEATKNFFGPWVQEVRFEGPAAKTIDDFPLTNAWVLARPWSGTAIPTAPEQTMSQFDLAYTSGAAAMIVSVRNTADGIPVCMEDGTVDRTTNGVGNVSAYLAKDLPLIDQRELDGNYYAPEPVPTLDQVLDRFGGKTLLIIVPKLGSSGVAAVNAAVDARGLKNSVLIGTDVNGTSLQVAAVAAGFKLYCWNVISVADVGTADTAGAFMVEMPVAVAADRITACQAATNIKRWVSQPVSKRSVKTTLNPNHHGINSEAIGYIDVTSIPETNIADEIQQRKIGLGWFVGSNLPTVARPLFNRDGLDIGAENQGTRNVLLGSLSSPKPGTYSVIFKYRFGAFAAEPNTRPLLRVACPSDEGIGDDATTRGYQIFCKKDGSLEIRAQPVGYGAGTNIGSTASPAIPDAGGDVTLRVDITPTTVTLTRVDSGTVIGPLSNTAWRGDYIWAGGTTGGASGHDMTLLEARIG